MILLVDNYDSFTYNLFQYMSELGKQVVVIRNNMMDIDVIEGMKPERIVISPGPSTPLHAGISNDVIKYFAPKLPILGVCLGHQCIGYSYGGRVIQANKIMHGKSSLVFHDGQGVFNGLPSPFSVIRYHSLIVQRASLPKNLDITAWTDDGTIMGLRHRDYPLEGVQFHPESFMSEYGKDLLKNFIRMEKKND